MKIIFFEAVHNFGGSSKSTLELAKRLKEEGNEVLIVDLWGASKPFVEECIAKKLPLKIIENRNKPIMIYNKGIISRIKNLLFFFISLLSYKKQIKLIADDFKPNLICVNSTKTLSILSNSKKYKIAYFARGWFIPGSFSLFEKSLLRKKVNIYLTVSQSTRQMVYAGKFAKLDRIFVVQNAIDQYKLDSFRLKKESQGLWHNERNNNIREFRMMHCGSFVETKGQHVAVEILKELINNGLNVKLLLVGMVSQAENSKKYFEKVTQQISKAGLDSDVKVILNESDVLKYFNETDVLIHPSYSEGLPRVVMEAMALGKPVIGNAVGGMTDFISNNFTGYLTNFNAVGEYVEIIEELIKDKQKYKFIADNGLALIKNNYTITNQVKEFMKIQNILSEP